MSSSLNIDSLSGLSILAQSVDNVLYTARDEMARARFEDLQDKINKLQVIAPNHPGVLSARVRWYEIGLDSFERHVVEPVEDTGKWPFTGGVGPLKVDPPHFLCSLNTFNHFLRRSYLKGDFPRMYPRVMKLYGRLVKARIQPDESATHELLAIVANHMIEFEQRLMHGQL